MLSPLSLLQLAITFGILLTLMHANASEISAPNDEGTPSCIEVEVDGARAPSFTCMSERLRPTQPAQIPNAPVLASEAITQRPGNQLGVFNRAATGNRMGNTFGSSVYPQRPPVNPTAAPVIPRAP